MFNLISSMPFVTLKGDRICRILGWVGQVFCISEIVPIWWVEVWQVKKKEKKKRKEWCGVFVNVMVPWFLYDVVLGLSSSQETNGGRKKKINK